MSSKHVRNDVKVKNQSEQGNKVILLCFPFGADARVAERLRDLEPVHTSEEGATVVGEVGVMAGSRWNQWERGMFLRVRTLGHVDI